MTRRSYQQYCPLAQALDLVGERWTLLVIRELQLGPRRFSDLLRCLPGLSPNLLTDRLRTLVSRGLISNVILPPPGKAQAYALTELGHSLNSALIPLAQWGSQFLQILIPEEEFLGPIPAMVGLRFFYHPKLGEEERLSCELHLGPDSFRVILTPSELQLEQGFFLEAALKIQTEPKPLLGLASGALSIDDALSSDLLQIEKGSREATEELFAQFSLPSG